MLPKKNKLQERYLVIRVLLKHLCADLNALIKSLTIEPADRQEERVHICLNSKYY